MKKGFPHISTERFLLRQFTEDDLDNIYLGLSHPDVNRYYGIALSNLDDAQKQLDWFKNLEQEETGMWWAICSRNDNTFIGAGGFSEVDKVNRKAEIGFWLLPEHWRRGIMTEVLPKIVSTGFDHLNLHRIEGFVEPENRNCKKGLEKLNFNFEGTMRDCEFKNNEFIDLDIYATISQHKT